MLIAGKTNPHLIAISLRFVIMGVSVNHPGHNMDEIAIKHGLLLKALVREAAEVQQHPVELVIEKERLEKRARELVELIRKSNE